MTNREWLESLSDEELAKIIRHCRMCVHLGEECLTNKPYDCNSGNVLWLQSEFTGLQPRPYYWITSEEEGDDDY